MSIRSRKLLSPALLLSFMAMAFTFDHDGITWFWSAQPIVAGVLAVAAAVAWGFVFRSPGDGSSRGSGGAGSV